jgi:hypothetical protein
MSRIIISVHLSMRANILLAMIFCQLNTYSQTVVLYKKTKDSIYVAADSRAVGTIVKVKNKGTYLQEYIVTEELTDNSCKIYFYNGMGMAFTGTYSHIAYKSAIEVLNKDIPAIEKMREYASITSKALADTMYATKLKDSEAFEKYADPVANAISEALFFGFNADTVFMCYIYFKRKDPALTDDKVLIQAFGAIPDKPQYCLGKCDQIQDTMKIGKIWKAGIVKTLKKLASISIKNNPKEVGGPIDIIKITRRGYEWIQCKSHCK